MSEYTPDVWVILKVDGDDPHYRVLGGFYGGYLYGNSWRLNSGIVSHELDGDYWKFYGSSGSCYRCYVDAYRMNTVTSGVYKQLGEKWDVTLLENQEWTKDDWDWIIG